MLYNDFRMRDILQIIIYNGNKAEQESAFKLIYQLCFDDKIAKDILNDTKLFNTILQNESKNCKGILMVINNKTKETNVKNNNINKHIMISYNSKSRETCLEIKKELENSGKNVWIDIENIGGSSLGINTHL
jgi:hydroxymethylpyrimidine pyrophosphatase-like HAD family hydrolase